MSPTRLFFLVCGSGRNCFVRVQYAVWVQRLFHPPHEFNCRRRPTVVDVFELAESDTMLGTDATTPLRYILIQERLDKSHNLRIILRTCSVEVKVS